VPWDAQQKAAFLETQFDYQDAAYRGSYPDASFAAVLLRGEPIGRLYVAHTAGEVRLVEITLAEGERNHGIGSWLIRGVMATAAAQHKPLVVHVDVANQGAKRLYLRLGFSVTADAGLYEELRWLPPPAPAGA